MASKGLTKVKVGSISTFRDKDGNFAGKNAEKARKSNSQDKVIRYEGTNQITPMPMGKDVSSALRRSFDGVDRTVARINGRKSRHRRLMNKARERIVQLESQMGEKPKGSRRYSRDNIRAKDPMVRPMRKSVVLPSKTLKRIEVKSLFNTGTWANRVRSPKNQLNRKFRSFGVITSGKNNIKNFR